MKEQLESVIAQSQASVKHWQEVAAKHRKVVEEATQQIQMNQGYLEGLKKALELIDAESPAEDTTQPS